uniref:Transposase n=1 Tax=Strongyloides venezuelensis TaxID=75913 RepID=A0A0K0FAX7_STRVS
MMRNWINHGVKYLIDDSVERYKYLGLSQKYKDCWETNIQQVESAPVVTFRNVTATQENKLWVNSYKYVNSETELCRRCNKAFETEMHIVSEYSGNMSLIKERHDNICKIIHRVTAKKMNMKYKSLNSYERLLA